MSISYSDFFAKLGRIVFWSDQLVGFQNSIYLEPTFGMADDVQNVFDNARDLVASFQQQCDSFASTMAGQISTLTQVANATLASLQLDLNAPGTTPGIILPALYRQMVIDGQSVLHNVIASPVVMAGAGNNGNGVLLVSTMNALGITDERSLTQDVLLLCTSSQWSGGTAGAETFSVTGYPQLPSPNVYGTLGNGNGQTLRVADPQNIISNGNFASFGNPTANVPNSWTLSAGTALTNCLQTTSVVHSGTSAMELKSDGTTPTITLTQNISSSIRSTTVYCISVWLRKGGTVTGGSTLAVTISGTGVTTQTAASLDPSTLTTSYAQYHLFFATQSIVPPSDYSVTINWTIANAASSSAIVYVADCVLIAPVVYGSIQYALFRGSVDFAVADSFTNLTTVSSQGAFQSYAARWFNFQFPSSASPTISDSLATNSS